jgi:pimeloyl-ACP methyl ester carboxylesterase
MAAVSPHGRLGPLRVPVYLLHGAGDNVIPPTETLWLEQDLPPGVPRQVLVTSAINHVEPGGSSSWSEQWALVHFLARILAETDAARSR